MQWGVWTFVQAVVIVVGSNKMRPFIGGIVSSYALFATVGLFFMMIVIYLRNNIMDFKTYLCFIVVVCAGAGLGSKSLFVITQIPDIAEKFSVKYVIYKIITSGFVFYGGLFGAIAGTLFFAKIQKYSKKDLLQLATPGYSIFHAFGRIGCFFAGCCYGKKANWGFALWNEPGVLRIPVQLIESFFLLILTGILLKMEVKLKSNIFVIYMMSYAVFRFIIEFFRGDQIRGIWGEFSTSQWISLFIVVGFGIWIIKGGSKCGKKK